MRVGSLPVVFWFVYIARCADESLYVGVARDVRARIAAHDAGKGARYTRGRGPLEVLATRRCASHGEALRLEAALKRLPRNAKLEVTRSARKLASLARSLRSRPPSRSEGIAVRRNKGGSNAKRSRGAKPPRGKG
jgi:putative endonuclease